MNTGIDYGLAKPTSTKKLIRYGCISQNSVLQAWADSSEPVYGKPIARNAGMRRSNTTWKKTD
jgi:hypothetical protein